MQMKSKISSRCDVELSIGFEEFLNVSRSTFSKVSLVNLL